MSLGNCVFCLQEAAHHTVLHYPHPSPGSSSSPQRQTIKESSKSRYGQCCFASLPVSPAEDTTDKMGHPKETCRLTYFFASQPASAARTFVQIVAADLPPPPAFCPRERVCTLLAAAWVGGSCQGWVGAVPRSGTWCCSSECELRYGLHAGKSRSLCHCRRKNIWVKSSV